MGLPACRLRHLTQAHAQRMGLKVRCYWLLPDRLLAHFSKMSKFESLEQNNIGYNIIFQKYKIILKILQFNAIVYFKRAEKRALSW